MTMDLDLSDFPSHEEAAVLVAASPDTLFDYLDDPARLGDHMKKRSWRTGGARMAYEFDAARGRSIGSEIRLVGDVLGLTLAVSEAVTERAPPRIKTWQTTGTPRLWAIGHYRMGFDLTPAGNLTRLRVFIDFCPGPIRPDFLANWLARFYSRWCVGQMARDAQARFMQ